ncbi:MAG: response regulator [Flavobacteriia bacterium]|nr:response regulator [Flavobacteriia bacterium]
MLRILLVDDDPIHNVILKRAIHRISPNIEVIDFEEPLSAIEHLKENSSGPLPSIIFLDLDMPIMNGFEFADALGVEFPHLLDSVAVHMVSSSVIPSDIQKANDHPNIDGFITKPVAREKLEELLSIK